MNLPSQGMNWPSTTMAEKGCLGCSTSPRGVGYVPMFVGRMPAAVAAKSSLVFLCQRYPNEQKNPCRIAPKEIMMEPLKRISYLVGKSSRDPDLADWTGFGNGTPRNAMLNNLRP